MTETLLERISFFPARNETITRLLEQIAERTIREFDIIAALQEEEGLVDKLLALTNQTMFGEAKLQNLDELIDLMGLPRLRNLLLTYEINLIYSEASLASGRTTGLSTRISWEHAISTALLAVELARIIKYPRLEEVMLAGVVHDLGRWIINLNMPREYGELLGQIYAQDVNVIEMELAQFGFTHEQAGAILLKRWHFPEPICAVAAYHHSCELASEHQNLVHIVTLANQLAVQEGTSFEHSGAIDLENNISRHYLTLTHEDCAVAVKRYRNGLSAYRKVFQH